MHFSSLLVGVAALLPAALAEITPPANFILQAKSIKGVSSNNLYNKEYMFTEFANPTSQVPLFTRINGYAQFFQLVDPDKSTNGTFYTLQSTPSYSATYIAEMDYKDNEFASWHPVNFVLPKKGVLSTVEENGFYIGGTESFMELMWTNKVKKPANGDFSGWLICYWSSLAPQLFFLGGGVNPAKVKVPSDCNVVTLQIVPAQA